ncbi:MAG: hypothetical protein ABW133_10705 [Polyangiaceae bacterium]
MNQERKVSVLRNLLDRVQKRAAAPRAAAVAVAGSPAAVSAAPSPVVTSPPLAISVPPAQPATSSGRPGAGTLPLDFHTRPEAASLRPSVHEAVTSPPMAPMASIAERERELERERQITSTSAFSEAPTSVPSDEEDEGPPSAPRLREAPEIEVAVEEEIDEQVEEHEPLLKTPPPESGRQHVTPGPSVVASEADADDDVSITVTMEESEVPPSVAAAVQEIAIANRAEPELPPQRLALVSEPEIELHGMTPLSAAIVEPIAPAKPAEPAPKAPAPEPVAAKPPPAPEPPAAKTPAPAPVAAKPAPPEQVAAKAEPEPSARPSFRPMDLDFAMPSAPPPAPAAPSVPAATPSGVRPAAGSPPAPPAPTAPPVEAAPAAPPVRMMVQPLADSGKPLPPVEVWASTFTPALQGEVATFVHHNAEAAPKTFAELVRASVALGQEKP